jgi:transcriptional regulator with XRE-family HTH domain
MIYTAINVMNTHLNPTQFGIEDIAYFKWDKSKGIILRQLRTDKKMTMKQLSQRISLLNVECSIDYLGALEHGRVESLKVDKLLAVAYCLGVPLSYFSSKQ